ncbi:MAG: Ig-like domain-containing protein [Lachnospiraceae bacterium]|nr:Ig-like domain-containing protein [Lachnospiraceae bacterium]
MRAHRRISAVIVAIAVSLSSLMIPQPVRAASDYIIEDTMLDFASSGSYTVKFANDEIERYVPVYIGKKGIISIQYEVSEGDVAFIDALDDVSSVDTKQFKIVVGDDYVDYNFFTFIGAEDEVTGFASFSYQEDEGELFYLDVTVLSTEYYQAYADNTWSDLSKTEQDRIVDELLGRGKSVTIKWEFSEIDIDKLSLEETDVTLATKGKLSKIKLEPVVKPEFATNTELLWSSSNTKVAKVSDKGVVTAVGKGKAKITGKTQDGSGKRVTCKVKVVDRNISLGTDNMSIGLKEKATLSAKVIPEEKYSWKVKDGSIVSVNKKGVIKGKKTGSTTVYIETATGAKASCKVTVFERKVTLDKSSVKLSVGSTASVSAKVTPSESYTWYSNDDSVAVVDGNGKITGVNAGTTSVYAVSASGAKSSKCAVTVEKKADVTVDDTVKTPVLSVNNKTVYKGNTIKVTLESGSQGGTWKCSSGFTIVSSSQTEIILKAGSAGIGSVTYTVGGKSAVVNVEVIDLFG